MLNTKNMRLATLLLSILAVAFVFPLPASYIVGPSTSPITPSTGKPGFVQTAEAHQLTGAPLSASFVSLPKINNVVIVGAGFSGGTVVSSLDGKVTDNQGNSYSRVILQSPNGSAPGGVSFWCTVVTVSSGTYTVSADSNAGSQKGLMIFEYGSTSCNPDKTVGALSAASPYSCGSLTTKNTNDLLLTFLLVPVGGASAFTAPSGFMIEQQQVTVLNGLTMAIADKVVSATNTFTPTFAANTNVADSQCAFVAMISH